MFKKKYNQLQPKDIVKNYLEGQQENIEETFREAFSEFVTETSKINVKIAVDKSHTAIFIELKFYKDFNLKFFSILTKALPELSDLKHTHTTLEDGVFSAKFTFKTSEVLKAVDEDAYDNNQLMSGKNK